jgi:hypothetical protein
MISGDGLIRIDRIDGREAVRLHLIHLLGLISLFLFVIFNEMLAKTLLGFSGTRVGSLCPFLNITGIPCPLCGLTRSFSSLLRGDVVEAFWYHPVGPLLFGGGAIAVTFSLPLLLLKRKITVRSVQSVRTIPTTTAIVLLIWTSNILLGHH